MPKKKWKLKGLEKALENVPPEDKFKVGNEIRKLFENFDPANPPGTPVLSIPKGTTVCPECGGTLIPFDTSNEELSILDCEKCDRAFTEET